MDRRHHTDQQLEGTAKPTGNAKKAGPQPWELERYIYQESSTDDGRSSHSDPRLELARRQQQDSAFIPSDGDHEYGYPGFGSYFTPHFDASDEWGTLAGGDKWKKQWDKNLKNLAGGRNMDQAWDKIIRKRANDPNITQKQHRVLLKDVGKIISHNRNKAKK
jgi:hypothetical protein